MESLILAIRTLRNAEFSHRRGKGEIVAKLTQSLYRLLFFCNLLFPGDDQGESEQDTNQEAGNSGKIGGKVSPKKQRSPPHSPPRTGEPWG
jgi:hypothetical protein